MNTDPIQKTVSPVDGRVYVERRLATAEEINELLRTARHAQAAWRNVPLEERAKVMTRFCDEFEKRGAKIADELTWQMGRPARFAPSEVRGTLERARHMIAIAPHALADLGAGPKPDFTRFVRREPLGVVFTIAAWNYPYLIAVNSVVPALMAGNAVILKHSAQTPLCAERFAECFREAGMPDGVFQVIHGGRETVEALCDHSGIAAISFVGSTKIAKVVYRRATANLKRVLALGGAKNHLIVMPDADAEMASSNIVASMAGCAGQRCMAASVMVAVSKVDHIIERMIAHARNIVPGRDLGPVISLAAKARIERYITEAEDAGATVLVDGRGVVVPGKENGYFIGPTIIDHVTPDMRIAQDEVFGPVLAIVRTKTVDEAIAVENQSPYGNAASVFTESGGVARHVMDRASAGMVGVNVGVPVPREPFSFGGWNESKFGVGDITGRGSIEFWTQSKKMTTKWNREAGTNWMS